MDQVAGQYRSVVAPADADCKMSRRVPRARHQPDMVVERMLAANEFLSFQLDDRQYAVSDCLDRRLGMLPAMSGSLPANRGSTPVRDIDNGLSRPAPGL